MHCAALHSFRLLITRLINLNLKTGQRSWSRVSKMAAPVSFVLSALLLLCSLQLPNWSSFLLNEGNLASGKNMEKQTKEKETATTKTAVFAHLTAKCCCCCCCWENSIFKVTLSSKSKSKLSVLRQCHAIARIGTSSACLLACLLVYFIYASC